MVCPSPSTAEPCRWDLAESTRWAVTDPMHTNGLGLMRLLWGGPRLMESPATDCSCWRFLLVGFAPCETELKRGSSLGQKLRVWAVEGLQRWSPLARVVFGLCPSVPSAVLWSPGPCKGDHLFQASVKAFLCLGQWIGTRSRGQRSRQ